MANYRLIIPHILQSEGGLSKNPDDNASAYPVPDGSGNHTNKGVTWKTFVDLASKIGYTATPQLFYSMPSDLWGKIFKQGYWNQFLGDTIQAQAVANMFADGFWIGGGSKQVKAVQTFLKSQGFNVSVDGVCGPQTVAAINKFSSDPVKQKTLLDVAYNAQMSFFQSLPDWPTFKNGWTARFQSLYTFSLDFLKKNSSTLVIATVLLFGAGVWYFSKK